MYLIGHNAHCIKITAPAVPTDTTLGIGGNPKTVRWAGQLEAYVKEDITDQVKGNMRVQISQTTIDLPANIPVWPNEEDLITIRRLDAIARYSAAAPQTEDLLVRRIYGGLLMLGKLRIYVVRS